METHRRATTTTHLVMNLHTTQTPTPFGIAGYLGMMRLILFTCNRAISILNRVGLLAKTRQEVVITGMPIVEIVQQCIATLWD